jgi:hypothetical protein
MQCYDQRSLVVYVLAKDFSRPRGFKLTLIKRCLQPLHDFLEGPPNLLICNVHGSYAQANAQKHEDYNQRIYMASQAFRAEHLPWPDHGQRDRACGDAAHWVGCWVQERQRNALLPGATPAGAPAQMTIIRERKRGC